MSIANQVIENNQMVFDSYHMPTELSLCTQDFNLKN